MCVAYTHGDVWHADNDDDDWQPCISNVHDFRTALLFSIETQTTIGYGSVYARYHTLCDTYDYFNVRSKLAEAHTHTHPFKRPFVRDCPGEPVPER